MIGWWLNDWPLESMLPGWPTLKPATALMSLLAGSSLALQATGDGPPWARAAGRACAAAAAVLAAVALAEGTADVDLGLDRLLAGRAAGPPHVFTATAYLSAAAALLLLDRPAARGPTVSQPLAMASGSIAFLALLGYAFRFPPLHGATSVVPHAGIALHGAGALLILTSGILAARPATGVMGALSSEHAGGIAGRRLLIGLLAFVPVGLLVLAGERLGWYGEPAVAALLVFLGLIEGTALILITAMRLDAYDTRRKASEELLRQSEQRVRQLIGQAPDGIFVADLDGRYTDVNDAGCRMLGRAREEIVGRRITDFIPPEDEDRLWREKDRMMGGGVMTSEWLLRHHDGSYLPVEVSASVLPDGRWQALVRDITDRKRAEEELREAREKDRVLRSELERVTRAAASVSEAVAALPQPDISAVLYTIALEAQILTDAKYVAVGLGTDPAVPFDPWVVVGMPQEVADEIGRSPRPLGTLGAVARDGGTLRVADVRKHPAFRGLPPHHPEMRSLLGVSIRFRGRPVGNIYLANKQGAAEFSEQDQRLVEMLSARAAVAIETAKLYAGAATQRAWLRSTIDQMPEGVIFLDERGQVVAANKAILALSREDTGQRDPWGNPDLFDVCWPDGSPISFPELPLVRAFQRGEVTMGLELALRQADRRLVPVLVNAAPVLDDAGRIMGAAVVVKEITALKALERQREEWASIIAHDLRQPVSAIVLTADALLRQRTRISPEKERAAVERIRSGAARLARMIEDLLDASRIEARRLSVSPQAVDVGALLASVSDSMREATDGGRLRVIAEPGLVAWVDPDRIQQVLTNLISNAVKYGQPGAEIRLEAADHGDLIEVAVSNHGHGIAPDQIPLLFTRFGRTRQAREDQTPGIGLGLYISKGLIEAHGGRIWVDSVLDKETSFHFLLPKASNVPDQPADAGAPPPP
jgi:PAS domain S-box-containing protein